MRAIYQGRFEPITKCIGFFDCEMDRLVAALASWQRKISRLDIVRISSVNGTADDAFAALQPLSLGKSRFLLVPTKSKWVACFDNYHKGPDVAGEVSYLTHHLSVIGLRVVLAEAPVYQFPACILELMGPRTEARPSGYIRTFTAANDGGKWVFEIEGEPQPFENPEYSERQMPQDRFNPDILDEYLHKLGIEMFKEDFFRWGESRLVYRWGIGGLVERTTTLAEVRRKLGLVS